MNLTRKKFLLTTLIIFLLLPHAAILETTPTLPGEIITQPGGPLLPTITGVGIYKFVIDIYTYDNQAIDKQKFWMQILVATIIALILAHIVLKFFPNRKAITAKKLAQAGLVTTVLPILTQIPIIDRLIYQSILIALNLLDLLIIAVAAILTIYTLIQKLRKKEQSWEPFAYSIALLVVSGGYMLFLYLFSDLFN